MCPQKGSLPISRTLMRLSRICVWADGDNGILPYESNDLTVSMVGCRSDLTAWRRASVLRQSTTPPSDSSRNASVKVFVLSGTNKALWKSTQKSTRNSKKLLWPRLILCVKVPLTKLRFYLFPAKGAIPVVEFI